MAACTIAITDALLKPNPVVCGRNYLIQVEITPVTFLLRGLKQSGTDQIVLSDHDGTMLDTMKGKVT